MSDYVSAAIAAALGARGPDRDGAYHTTTAHCVPHGSGDNNNATGLGFKDGDDGQLLVWCVTHGCEKRARNAIRDNLRAAAGLPAWQPLGGREAKGLFVLRQGGVAVVAVKPAAVLQPALTAKKSTGKQNNAAARFTGLPVVDWDDIEEDSPHFRWLVERTDHRAGYAWCDQLRFVSGTQLYRSEATAAGALCVAFSDAPSSRVVKLAFVFITEEGKKAFIRLSEGQIGDKKLSGTGVSAFGLIWRKPGWTSGTVILAEGLADVMRVLNMRAEMGYMDLGAMAYSKNRYARFMPPVGCQRIILMPDATARAEVMGKAGSLEAAWRSFLEQGGRYEVARIPVRENVPKEEQWDPGSLPADYLRAELERLEKAFASHDLSSKRAVGIVPAVSAETDLAAGAPPIQTLPATQAGQCAYVYTWGFPCWKQPLAGSEHCEEHQGAVVPDEENATFLTERCIYVYPRGVACRNRQQAGGYCVRHNRIRLGVQWKDL